MTIQRTSSRERHQIRVERVSRRRTPQGSIVLKHDGPLTNRHATPGCTCSADGLANPLHHEITCPYAQVSR
jgi:hypothetical protein